MRLTGEKSEHTLNKLCYLLHCERPSAPSTCPGGSRPAAPRSVARWAKVATDVVPTTSTANGLGQYLFDAVLDAGRESGIEPDGFA